MSIAVEPASAMDADGNLTDLFEDRSDDLPTKKEVLAAIPEHCFQRSLGKSMLYAIASLFLTVTPAVCVYLFMPMTWAWLPGWIVYAMWTGTAATGCWVVAHECGHRAFCKQNWIQDTLGFTLHSALLVPYFSWQRSHAIHHARTNHLDLGETFVPTRAGAPGSKLWTAWQRLMGDEAFALFMMIARFTVGWPVYLMTGASGGPARGRTNHFWPTTPFSNALFPGQWQRKVIYSTIGVAVVIGLLAWWGIAEGSFLPVLAVYIGPYMVVNFWLVLYTWLQHTHEDVPHFDEDEWTWVRGAFMTIDRPYGPILDFLHHRIGSTHVAHHIDARIPHYNALAATHAIRDAFPHLYLYDPTPIHKALWRTAVCCNVVDRADIGWKYTGRSKRSDA